MTNESRQQNSCTMIAQLTWQWVWAGVRLTACGFMAGQLAN